MPLIRIETRTKSSEEPAPTPAPVRRPREESGGRAGLAIAGGAVFGLLCIAGLSLALVRGWAGPLSRTAAATDVPQPAGSIDPAAVAGETPPGAALPGSSTIDALVGPSSINPEFNLEDPIAQVNSATVSMRDLDRAVRVSQVLAELSGEPPVEIGAVDFRDHQIKMLKRLVDLELLHQAAIRAGLLIPGGGTDELVDQFLTEHGKTRADLEAASAKRNVTPAELDRWFRDARTANFFVTQQLTVGNETVSRDELTATWLEEQWASQQITINFYEP